MNDIDLQKKYLMFYTWSLRKMEEGRFENFNKNTVKGIHGLKNCPLCESNNLDLFIGDELFNPNFDNLENIHERPYCISCECGLVFQIGKCTYEEISNAWNKRVDKCEKLV